MDIFFQDISSDNQGTLSRGISRHNQIHQFKFMPLWDTKLGVNFEGHLEFRGNIVTMGILKYRAQNEASLCTPIFAHDLNL